MAITAAQDVAGFGRLGQMKMAKRAEEREERRLGIAESRAAQQHRLGALQIKQMETNLQTVRRQAQLKQGLGLALQNIPEGENQFTTAYNYFMMSGAPDEAQKYMDNQSDRIEDIWKMDKERGIEAYNQTIGKLTGSTLEYVKEDPVQGDILKTTDKDDNIVYGSRTKSGDFKPFPKEYTPVVEEDEPKRTKTIVDLELEDAVTDRFVKEEGLSEVDARLRAQSFIAENKRGQGISITQDAEGRPVIQIGGKERAKLTRGTETDVQKKLLEANATYSDMKAIVGKIEDRFLEIPTRIGTKITALKEKWGMDVSREDRQELKDYTDFRREAISSLNAYIKQITGAAMSELEAKRLMKAMPTPGLGLMDGDSPTEFKTKLNGVMESLDRVIARNNYVAKHGLASFEDVGLDQMDGIIDRRGEELESEMRAANPDMDQAELENQIMQTLSEEFGIRF
jgi:hypothetical protein